MEIACKDVDPNQFVSVFHLVAEITRRTASFVVLGIVQCPLMTQSGHQPPPA
jgi:hypothetical protein